MKPRCRHKWTAWRWPDGHVSWWYPVPGSIVVCAKCQKPRPAA